MSEWLSEVEQNALRDLYLRPDHYIDDTSRAVSAWLEMKAYGAMSYRILNSTSTYTKVRKTLAIAGLDPATLPDWTERGDQLRGVRLYKAAIETGRKAQRLFEALSAVDRTQGRELRHVD